MSALYRASLTACLLALSLFGCKTPDEAQQQAHQQTDASAGATPQLPESADAAQPDDPSSSRDAADAGVTSPDSGGDAAAPPAHEPPADDPTTADDASTDEPIQGEDPHEEGDEPGEDEEPVEFEAPADGDPFGEHDDEAVVPAFWTIRGQVGAGPGAEVIAVGIDADVVVAAPVDFDGTFELRLEGPAAYTVFTVQDSQLLGTLSFPLKTDHTQLSQRLELPDETFGLGPSYMGDPEDTEMGLGPSSLTAYSAMSRQGGRPDDAGNPGDPDEEADEEGGPAEDDAPPADHPPAGCGGEHREAATLDLGRMSPGEAGGLVPDHNPNGCLDSDGDGVPNLDDVDGDDDGIPDHLEAEEDLDPSAGHIDVFTPVRFHPPTQSHSVSLVTRPWVRFSRPVSPDQPLAERIILERLTADGGAIPLPAEVRLDASRRRAIIRPEAPMADGHRHRVRVLGTLVDAEGQALGQRISSSFNTGSPPGHGRAGRFMTVARLNPPACEVDVPVDTLVSVVFDRVLHRDAGVIGPDHLQVVDPEGQGVEGQLVTFDDGRPNEERRALAFRPTAPLQPGTTYLIRIGQGLEATNRMRLEQPLELDFTTAEAIPADP